MVFFEGSEKKIEVIFNRKIQSLRQLPPETWVHLVEAAKAKILSKVSNQHMDAYLLSESSLFVYDHYLVMITCGTTQLIAAVDFLLKKFSSEDIEAFFYERKNEILPHAQPSHFLDDIKMLKARFNGEALRFGFEDEHHLFLFASTKPYKPQPDDHTMEVLMHGVKPSVLKSFSKAAGEDKAELRKRSGIDQIVRGQVDDFVFDPMGYSLNAIDGPHYFTIHVTPQKFGNYTSFETNAFKNGEQIEWAKKVLAVFQPQSFDLVLFNQAASEKPEFENYITKRFFRTEITAGYSVQYFSYFYPQRKEQAPVRL